MIENIMVVDDQLLVYKSFEYICTHIDTGTLHPFTIVDDAFAVSIYHEGKYYLTRVELEDFANDYMLVGEM